MAGFNINDLLNAKSKGAAVQAEGPAEQEQEFKVTMLDVEDLMPSKDNFYSTENIDELAMSIELVGHIEQNLVVKPEAHGKYEVVAGHRRRLAALKLVQEGKEEYRKVPCLIKKESDTIKDKLSLIFTNATARQLTDWEKVQQAKELKEILTEYKRALQEENKDKPKEEREKMGRIRDIVAQMLNTSTTQIGRMEAIENNLSQEYNYIRWPILNVCTQQQYIARGTYKAEVDFINEYLYDRIAWLDNKVGLEEPIGIHDNSRSELRGGIHGRVGEISVRGIKVNSAISIYNANGLLICNKVIKEFDNSFKLPKGMYIVKIKDDSGSIRTEKVAVR